MQTKTHLIEVFGLEGSGKTTLIQNTKAELNKRGLSVLVVNPLQFYDPFLRDVFCLIQKVPKKDDTFHKRAEVFLSSYFSFALVNQTLKAHSENCDIVIYDRYLTSHFLNQAAFGEDVSVFQPLFDLLPKPTFAVIIDVPVEVALKRLSSQGGLQPHENEKHFTKARKLHLSLAQKKNYPIIEGTLPKEQQVAEMMRLLENKKIGLKKKSKSFVSIKQT